MEKYLKIFKNNLLIIILTFLIIIEISVLKFDSITSLFYGSLSTPKDEITINNYAKKVIEKCSSEEHRSSCYDKEIPKLMDKIIFEDTFRVTRIVQKHEGDKYAYCHILGHNLSAKETAKDSSKWKEVITRCPSGMCSNGCIHGAFQEKFRTESMTDTEIDELIPELKTVCEARGIWSPTGLEQASCYHAMGHLIMYISGGNINKSNEVCEKVAPNILQMCYDGNFMQIFQPLETEDIDLVKDFAPKTIEEAEKFCNNYTGLKKSSCHQESWPLYFSQIITPTGLVKFCSYTQDTAVQTRCYNSLFYVITAQFKLDPERIEKFCSAIPDPRKGLCFSDSASRMIETDYSMAERAVALCRIAETFNVGDSCYNELIKYSTFNYHKGSSEAKYLCSVLPKIWKNKCENKL